MKRCFAKDVEDLKTSNKLQEEGQVFRNEEFSKLPIVIQRYIEHCRMALISSSMFGVPFEEISDYEVKATIYYAGQSASGIFWHSSLDL